VCPIAIGSAVHAFKMIRREDRLTLNMLSKIREILTDVINQDLRGTIAQLTPLFLIRIAGKVKTVGAGYVLALWGQRCIQRRWHRKGQGHFLR